MELASRVRRKSTHRDPQYAAPEYLTFLGRLAGNLRQMRGMRGWTQEEAAVHCADMAPYVYRRIEGAHTNLTATTLIRLAMGFGVDVAELVATTPPVPPSPRSPTPGRSTEPTRTSNPPQSTVGSAPEPSASDDAEVRAQLRAHRLALLIEVERVDGILAGFGEPIPQRPSPRLQPTSVVLPPLSAGRFDLRGFVLDLLRANPLGLTTPEMIQAARDAGRKRIRPNDLHTIVHNLHQGGHVIRGGARGGYIYQLRAPG